MTHANDIATLRHMTIEHDGVMELTHTPEQIAALTRAIALLTALAASEAKVVKLTGERDTWYARFVSLSEVIPENVKCGELQLAVEKYNKLRADLATAREECEDKTQTIHTLNRRIDYVRRNWKDVDSWWRDDMDADQLRAQAARGKE